MEKVETTVYRAMTSTPIKEGGHLTFRRGAEEFAIDLLKV
jgi:hypothetical protein